MIASINMSYCFERSIANRRRGRSGSDTVAEWPRLSAHNFRLGTALQTLFPREAARRVKLEDTEANEGCDERDSSAREIETKEKKKEAEATAIPFVVRCCRALADSSCPVMANTAWPFTSDFSEHSLKMT